MLSRYKWHAVRYREPSGEWWYARSKIGGKSVPMHHLITGKNFVDHKDGDGLNNTRLNLRPCTPSQNMAITGSRGGTSRHKGVSWRSAKRRRAVAIMANNRQYFLGYFEDEEEAAIAANEGYRTLYGDFARLNTI